MRTSNFKNLPNAVAISQGVPRGWRGLRYLALAPSRALRQGGSQPGGAEDYQRLAAASMKKQTIPRLVAQAKHRMIGVIIRFIMVSLLLTPDKSIRLTTGETE